MDRRNMRAMYMENDIEPMNVRNMRAMYINKENEPMNVQNMRAMYVNRRNASIPKTTSNGLQRIQRELKRKQSDLNVKSFLHDVKKEGLDYYYKTLNRLYVEATKLLRTPGLYPIDESKFYKEYENLNAIENDMNTKKLNFIDYDSIFVYRNSRKVYSMAKRKLINHEEFVDIYKKRIQERIGPCHLSEAIYGYTGKAKLKAVVNYLPNLMIQLRYIAKSYMKEKNKKRLPHTKNKFRKKFMDTYGKKLYGRPCLDNILDAGVNMFVERDFVWKGRDINMPLQLGSNADVSRYIMDIIIPAIQSFQDVHKEDKTYKDLNLDGRKKRFWDYIKDRPVFAIRRDGVIGYFKTKDFDKNGKYLERNEAKNYMNLLEINVE